MQNKKGISEVVTTVLIVLLTIVAIAILWGFLQPLFTKSGVKVQMAEQCLSVSLEVTSCVNNAATGPTNVSVKRTGAATLKEVKVILTKPNGETVAISQVAPDELETKLYSNLLAGTKATSVSVAAGIADAQGAVNYCTPTQPVNCA
jgi:flagellin-like protein